MIYPEIALAQSIIAICKAHQIQHIIISPGSRNAPLTIGFNEDSYFTCYSIVDERCAAFFGLGIAQQTQHPVALVCTSGSALLNYYPALAEAFYSQIPLLVISADRPNAKIDIGDGQTIRQRNVFANHSVFNANLTEEAGAENDHLINEAIIQAKTQSGPAHINAPFEEPLYNTVNSPSVSPTFHHTDSRFNTAFSLDDSLTQQWNRYIKKLVLVGVCQPGELSEEEIGFLADDPSVAVLTETTSNIHHPNYIQHIDRIITPFEEKDFEEFRPDLLITFGGMVVSKRIKAFLRAYPPKEHWHIDPLRHYDTYGCLTRRIHTPPKAFFKKLKSKSVLRLNSEYQCNWLRIAKIRQQKHKEFTADVPYSDFKVFDVLLNALPEQIQLQISNSSAIRYAQLFPISNSIEVFCNRGTSGIDGSTSTSIGAAVSSGKPTLLLTGDISFFYDSNGLWNNYIPHNYKIILINNQGGGIFRILPGHRENKIFHTYFETKHQLQASFLSDMYGFKYYKSNTLKELKEKLPVFFKFNEKPAILEICTPAQSNDIVLKDYFKNLL